MIIRSLETESPESLSHVFNRAFSDYEIPLQFSAQGMSDKMKAENIDLKYSAGAFVHGEPVAFILTGKDVIDGEKRVYNAGTGVVPEFRGRRLPQQIYQYLIPFLQGEGYFRHQLEVLENNIKASRVYEKLGFKTLRQTGCFRGLVNPACAIKLEPVSIQNLDWDLAETFHDFKPTWQNSRLALERSSSLHQLLVAKNEQGDLMGYVTFVPGNGRIKQFAVNPDFRRRGIASALFAAVASLNPAREVSLINVDESSRETLAFLSALGLQRFAGLFEMEACFAPTHQ